MSPSMRRTSITTPNGASFHHSVQRASDDTAAPATRPSHLGRRVTRPKAPTTKPSAAANHTTPSSIGRLRMARDRIRQPHGAVLVVDAVPEPAGVGNLV